jgi:hypothetical protein
MNHSNKGTFSEDFLNEFCEVFPADFSKLLSSMVSDVPFEVSSDVPSEKTEKSETPKKVKADITNALATLLSLTRGIKCSKYVNVSENRGDKFTILMEIIDNLFRYYTESHRRNHKSAKECANDSCVCSLLDCKQVCTQREICETLINSGLFKLTDCVKIAEDHGLLLNIDKLKNARGRINKRIRRVMVMLFALMKKYPDLEINSFSEIKFPNAEMKKMLFNAGALESVKKYPGNVRMTLYFNGNEIVLNNAEITGISGEELSVDEFNKIIRSYTQRKFSNSKELISVASVKYPHLFSFSSILDILGINRRMFLRKHGTVRNDLKNLLDLPDGVDDDDDDDVDYAVDDAVDDDDDDDDDSEFIAKRICLP